MARTPDRLRRERLEAFIGAPGCADVGRLVFRSGDATNAQQAQRAGHTLPQVEGRDTPQVRNCDPGLCVYVVKLEEGNLE